MRTSQLIFCVPLFAVFFSLPGHGEISSWTDESGVRHYSNVETSEEKKTVEVQEEYVTDEADEAVDQNRDRFQILEMYKEDREKEQQQKALEKEMREAEKREKQEREVEERTAREKQKACEEGRRKLDDLHHSKWEDYDAPGLSAFVCPDKHWKGARGKVYDNMQECTERRDKARKSAYEEALRQLQDEVQSLCVQ
jgi:hypothetical protein